MAEAVVLNLDSDIHYFTVLDGQAIPKGTLLVLSADPRTATMHSPTLAVNEIPLGYTVEAKVAGDGLTRIGVRTRGILDLLADGAITFGDLVEISAASGERSSVKTSAAGETFSKTNLRRIIGVSLETASDNEVILILLRFL